MQRWSFKCLCWAQRIKMHCLFETWLPPRIFSIVALMLSFTTYPCLYPLYVWAWVRKSLGSNARTAPLLKSAMRNTASSTAGILHQCLYHASKHKMIHRHTPIHKHSHTKSAYFDPSCLSLDFRHIVLKDSVFMIHKEKLLDIAKFLSFIELCLMSLAELTYKILTAGQRN